jgi:hypothetical protein
MRSLIVAILGATSLLAGVPGVEAQTSCQPTITQPCAPPPRSDTAASKSADSNQSNEARRDRRRGLSVGPDATVGFTPGVRGLGLQQRF